MTLKRKFILLILGTLFVPVLTMGTAFWIYQKFRSVTDPSWVAEEFHLQLKDLNSVEDFPEFMEKLNDSYFAIVIEEPEFIATSDEDLFNINSFHGNSEKSPRLIINSRIHTLADGSQVQVIFGMNIFNFRGRIIPLIFIGLSISVLILTSLLIIRSINRSISRLEEATGKIAEGDLDFEIDRGGQDKFGSLARSLHTMREQIKTEYDRRNRFFMGISHDLKTPLSSITGYADALTEGMAEDRDSRDRYLKIIKDKSHLLEQRITHLIHYMKLSNYDFQASLEEIALHPFLQSFMVVQQEEAGFKGITLESHIDISPDYRLHFDEDLLRRALENLLQNAYRYGNGTSSVKFSCHEIDKSIELIVENRGAVITDEQLKHIFEPFFRGDKSRKGDGFGLGLASVKSIVESHGWSITAESSESRTRFIIVVPPVKKLS